MKSITIVQHRLGFHSFTATGMSCSMGDHATLAAALTCVPSLGTENLDLLTEAVVMARRIGSDAEMIEAAIREGHRRADDEDASPGECDDTTDDQACSRCGGDGLIDTTSPTGITWHADCEWCGGSGAEPTQRGEQT